MTTTLQDLRYGVRMLARSPGFTLVAVLTLALGIGANAAMFGVVDALLFRPPSGVSAPSGLVRVQMELPLRPGEQAELSGVLSYPDYTTLRDRAGGFARVSAYARTTVTIGRAEEERPNQALLVTGDYFRLLGTRPALGRLIAPDDDREGSPNPVAVLSWSYWNRALAGDASVVGQPIVVNGRSYTVVGVAPQHFVGTELGSPALWLPLGVAPSLGYDERMTRSRFAAWLSIVARLAPGVTRQQAQSMAEGAILAARDEGADVPPGAMGGVPGGEVRVRMGGPGGAGGPGAGPAPQPPPPRVRLAELRGRGAAGIPAPLGGGQSLPVSLWFMAVTAAVLLIACANVANLMLARATNRQHEIAVRLSLGATRGRLARQLMTENLLLAALGGAAGLAVAAAGVALLPRVVPLPPLPPFLDERMLAFTALLTVLTTAAFGLAPALRATRPDLHAALSAAGRRRAGRPRGRSALVVVQLAASLVLLIGAGLFIRSLRNVRSIDVGFDTDHLLVASIDQRGARSSREQMDGYWRAALERVRALPGVRSAALGMSAPFEMSIMLPLDAPGYPSPDGRPRPAQADFAGAGYFATLGIEITRGRAFTEEDRAGTAPVAIVNETLARQIWGGDQPLGKCVRVGAPGGDAPCLEVVGVAEDAKYADLTAPAAPFLYRPLEQRLRMAPPMTVLHVRASGDPAALAARVRQELQGLDPAVRFASVRPLSDLMLPQIMPWRMGTLIFTLFGSLGLLLAAVGLYGVLSFLVAQRTRELGVRIALGARTGDVLALVLGQGARLIVLGIAAGLLGGAVAARLFASMMYGVSPLDPLVYLSTAVVLGAIGMVATYVPARRATRVDPIVALRAE